jgi:hypothetical protein
MNKKVPLRILVSAIGFLFICTGIHAAQEVSDSIELNSAVYETHRKPIVNFTHTKHAADYGIACTECHHVIEDGKNVWKEGDPVQKCNACHSKDKPSPDERKRMSDAERMKAFHYEAIHENCKGCHNELKKAGKPTGPISCNKCHVR